MIISGFDSSASTLAAHQTKKANIYDQTNQGKDNQPLQKPQNYNDTDAAVVNFNTKTVNKPGASADSNTLNPDSGSVGQKQNTVGSLVNKIV